MSPRRRKPPAPEGFAGERWEVRVGDCLEVLRAVPDASVDAVVTDPPSSIGFMNVSWDHDRGGRDQWVAWLASIMAECLRVLKPGGHALVWALPRTSHWTGWAVESAGFEVRDRVSHLFAQGMPKSLNVSKAIDRAAGLEREPDEYTGPNYRNAVYGGGMGGGVTTRRGAPTHPAAVQFDGFGTGLKPSVEDYWLARKPLARGLTVAANVVEFGTGALNIDAARIRLAGERIHEVQSDPATLRGVGLAVTPGSNKTADEMARAQAESVARTNDLGRWPAHLVLSHSENCWLVGVRRVSVDSGSGGSDDPGAIYGKHGSARSTVAHAEGGTEEVEDWACVEGCPVAELDRQSGVSTSRVGLPRRAAPGDGWGMTATGAEYADRGGASRFFFVAKPSSAERDAGLADLPVRTPGELTGRVDGRAGTTNPRAGASASASGGRRNGHPTVKSVALMRYLVRLITPFPGALVLDPFAGSGTTGCAALIEGFRFLGVEREPDYLPILRARLTYAAQRPVGGEYVTAGGAGRDDAHPAQMKLL